MRLLLTSTSCFGLNMLTTLPLEAFVCRSVMTTYYFPEEPHNSTRHILFTTALVVSSMVLSLITCDLGSVFELIGATSAAALAYIFPPLCYIKLSSASRREKIPAYLCVCFGVLVMVVSVVQAVVKIIRSESSLPSFISFIPTLSNTNEVFSRRRHRSSFLQCTLRGRGVFSSLPKGCNLRPKRIFDRINVHSMYSEETNIVSKCNISCCIPSWFRQQCDTLLVTRTCGPA